MRGLAAALSPPCKALSPTTPLEGGCFVSAFSSCLAVAHRPGPKVRGWGRGQGKGDQAGGQPRELASLRKAKARTWALPWWPRRGDTGNDRSAGQEPQWSQLGQNRAPHPLAPGPGRAPPGQVAQAQLSAEGAKPPTASRPRHQDQHHVPWPGPTRTPPALPTPGPPAWSPPCPSLALPRDPMSPSHIRPPRATAPGSPPRGSPAPARPGTPVPLTPASPR